jgi:quinolinate synthase
MVIAALAEPPALLTAAVAVNTSAAACPRGDADVTSNAAESVVKPIVLNETVIAYLL